MADPINDRYKKAAQVRLMSMMPPAYQPNYPDEYGVGQIMRALLAGKPQAVAPQPAVSDADMAQPTMAPPPGLLAPTVSAAPVTVTANRPPAGPLAPPVTVQADPRTAGDADLAGYGASPRQQSDMEKYAYLNPTPSLAEVYRREYAANPNGFTPGRFFGLFGS